MEELRESLASAKRVVVKIGSRTLATDGQLEDIARQLAVVVKDQARQCVLVSSGAVALGWQRLGYAQRPQKLAQLQAAAAAGQSELMYRYSESLRAHGVNAAQILLTHSDLASRRRITSAQHTLAALFETNAIPVVNENDVVSTTEIAFGDNDQLASMVTPMVQADALLLLTDVAGVLDDEGKRIDFLKAEQDVTQRSSGNQDGKGGIFSKIDAARKAARAGATVVIGPGQETDSILRILAGEALGTMIAVDEQEQLRARQHWIAYTLKPRGTVVINEGAAAALQEGTRSLLPVGVVGVSGTFSRGDSVSLVKTDGNEIGRGLAQMNVIGVASAAGKTSQELAIKFGDLDPVVVNKDDLVLL